VSPPDGIEAMRAKREERAKRAPLPPRHKPTVTPDQQQPDSTDNESAGAPAGVSASENASASGNAPAAEPAAVSATAAAGDTAAATQTAAGGGASGGVNGSGRAVGADAAAGPEPVAVREDSGPGGGAAAAGKKPAPSTWRPPRRVGRPRGPERIALSVRILAELDARLTEEVERQGLSPQFLVDQALADYFARLDRARQRVATGGQKAGVSASENDGGKDSDTEG
jgi:predicted transcriptional regulator